MHKRTQVAWAALAIFGVGLPTTLDAPEPPVRTITPGDLERIEKARAKRARKAAARIVEK